MILTGIWLQWREYYLPNKRNDINILTKVETIKYIRNLKNTANHRSAQ